MRTIWRVALVALLGGCGGGGEGYVTASLRSAAFDHVPACDARTLPPAQGALTVEDMPAGLVLVRDRGVPVCLGTLESAVSAGVIGSRKPENASHGGAGHSDPMPADGRHEVNSDPMPAEGKHEGNSDPMPADGEHEGDSDPMPAGGK